MFEQCASIDEIRTLYKHLAVKMHPDKPGGTKEQFQELQSQYEAAKKALPFKPIIIELPNYFNTTSNYEYFRRKVKYQRKDTKYYYFDFENIALLRIDKFHTHLIKSL